jgi:UDP-N-acetylmuramoyl-tripeptide--D-alanyl-D-alanine ligase
MSSDPLWTVEAMAQAMGASRGGALPASISGISIDSRSVGRGEAFFAIKGDARDGHEFVSTALANGAGLAVVAAEKRAAFPKDAPLLVVADVLEGLRDLARAARERSTGTFIAVTGSVGKTSTKEALRLALAPSGETHASVASYNNHWGVPLSLARCPASARFAVFEIGMNHAGEIEPLSRLVRPHIAIVTAIEPVHLEFFKSMDAIADAKAEIFLGLELDSGAVLNRDSPYYERLRRQAKRAGAEHFVSFGEHPRADARVIKVSLHPDCSTVQAKIRGTDVTYKVGAPGRHLVLNSLAVLAAVSLAGADLALAALALAGLTPPTGRGVRSQLDLPGGRALLIDESYNANPASMQAAIALLGQADVAGQGRRIAVLGDMLELGPSGADLHRGLVEPVVAQGIDLVFCCGPLMHSLWEALPTERRGAYAETSAALEPQVLAAIRPGDAIMIKGSLGSRMGPIVKALMSQFRRSYSLAASTDTNVGIEGH